MRVDSSESEVRQDEMSPCRRKVHAFCICLSRSKDKCKRKQTQGLTVHYCIRCCIKETQNPFSLMRYCKPLYKKRKELCMSKNENNYLTVIVTVALLIALDVILTRFLSIQTQSLRIGFGFLPVAVAGIAYGPFWGAVTGAVGGCPRYDHLSAGRVFSGIYADGSSDGSDFRTAFVPQTGYGPAGSSRFRRSVHRAESPAGYALARYYVRQQLYRAAACPGRQMRDQYPDLHAAHTNFMGKRAFQYSAV